MREESNVRDESKVWIPRLKNEELWYVAQILQQHCRESNCNKCIFHCSNRMNIRCILHDGNDPMLWLLGKRKSDCEEVEEQTTNDELFEAAMSLKHYCEKKERCVGCRFYSLNHCLIHDFPAYWKIDEREN